MRLPGGLRDVELAVGAGPGVDEATFGLTQRIIEAEDKLRHLRSLVAGFREAEAAKRGSTGAGAGVGAGAGTGGAGSAGDGSTGGAGGSTGGAGASESSVGEVGAAEGTQSGGVAER